MRYFFFLLGYFAVSLVLAQKQDYTTEKARLSQPTAKTCQEIEVIFEVTIQPNWYIYATEFAADGPQKATFNFTPHPSYALVGKPESIKPKRKHDEVWEGEIAYFEKKAEFRQKIKILSSNLDLSGSYNFQTCSTINGVCLPPETVKFSFKAKDIKITGTNCK